MAKILTINSSKVQIGTDDNKIIEAPIAALNFSNPQVGESVIIYQNGKQIIVARADSMMSKVYGATADGQRHVNKILYVLLSFCVGGFGVHRFLRGQIGLGVLMIFLNPLTLGIWWLVDFIIGLVKLTEFPGDDFVFAENGDWAH